jgi:CcmD family protein
MRLIKKGALLLFIASLFMIAARGVPGDAGTNGSVSILSMNILHAQEIEKPQHAAQEKEQKTEHASTLYQVMGVVLFIWFGLAVFLFRLDRKVARLEEQAKDRK